jgi:16S rRNA (guanine527-N7)-methyltransferase
VKHEEDASELHRTAADLGVHLSPTQAGALLELEALLLERAVPAGMIAGADAPRLRERHVLDCLRAGTVVEPTDRDAYDLGSGAGLPGLVLAVGCPRLRMTLVETRRRRVAFLELAIERLGLTNAAVAARRIEDLHDPVDLCFARALAPPAEAWRLAQPLLRPEGRLVYFAGRGATTADVPGTRTTTLRTAVLERSGPLVIMAR